MMVMHVDVLKTWINSRMVGNSSQHAINNVVIEDFTINGTAVQSLADLNTLPTTYVYNVTFLK